MTHGLWSVSLIQWKVSCKLIKNPSIQASVCTPCLSKQLQYHCLQPPSWKVDPCHELQHLVQPSIRHHHVLGSMQRRGWWCQWVVTHSATRVWPAAWRGWAPLGPVDTAPHMPHPSSCRESLPACSPLSFFALPLMHPKPSSNSFSLLIWQKKGASSCWVSWCQLNELNLPTEVSDEWEDQRKEHTV